MVYVASDLHGFSMEKFLSALQELDFSSSDTLFVLGDVIDHGWDGIRIMKWLSTQENCKLIMGNHEEMMLSCAFYFDDSRDISIPLSADETERLDTWRDNGGRKTIEALFMEPSEIREQLFDALRHAPLFQLIQVDGREYLLTHGGLGGFELNKPLSDYTRDELLWNRPHLTDHYFNDITTILGHTPTLFYGEAYYGKPLFHDTWINIDAGVSMGLPPIILRLDDMQLFCVDT